MQKISLTIRVDADDLSRWQAAAKKLGESTSAWMRRILNGGSSVVEHTAVGTSGRGNSAARSREVAGSSPDPRIKPSAEEPKLCISCEGELSSVKGKWACTDESCGMRGIEQKGKR